MEVSNILDNDVLLILILINRRNSNIILNQNRMMFHLLCAMHYYRQSVFLFKLSKSRKIQRNIWSYNRLSTFWEEEVVKNGWTKFKEDFRMNPEVFKKLCYMLGGISKKDTKWRNSIPLEKRVAISMYVLGSSCEYRTIANLFGVGRTTIGEICLEFCREVWHKMKEKYLPPFPFPTEKISNIISGFENMGFPQCIGALDGCHIRVSPPKELAADYYNYKGWYSTNLLALVDYQYRFIYINVGAPGRYNDSQIFENSNLKKYMESNNSLVQFERNINGTRIPVYMIGDSAFRLSPYLMKPFPFGLERNEKKKNFNKSLFRCRQVVEIAFSHVKARFRRIGKGLDVNIDNVNIIIKACCVLHNFLSEEKDIIPRRWIIQMQETTRRQNQPVHITKIGNHNVTGNQIRNVISEFIGPADAVEELIDVEDVVADDTDTSPGEGSGGRTVTAAKSSCELTSN